MLKRIVLIMLGALAVTGGGYLYVRSAANHAADTTLRISGNIEAHESVVSFKVQGRIMELPVQEGQIRQTRRPVGAAGQR